MQRAKVLDIKIVGSSTGVWIDRRTGAQSCENSEQLSSVFGTEKDPKNCSFFWKLGVCRWGDDCRKVHNTPLQSPTILCKNMYDNPPEAITIASEMPWDDETYDRAQKHLESAYRDIFAEFSRFGEVENVIFVDNLVPWMIGDVYIKYRNERAAEKAIKAMTGRYYAGKQIDAAFTNVFDFQNVRCGQHHSARGKCMGYKGEACAFIHMKHIPQAIQRRAKSAMYAAHPEYLIEEAKEEERDMKKRAKIEAQLMQLRNPVFPGDRPAPQPTKASSIGAEFAPPAPKLPDSVKQGGVAIAPPVDFNGGPQKERERNRRRDGYERDKNGYSGDGARDRRRDEASDRYQEADTHRSERRRTFAEEDHYETSKRSSHQAVDDEYAPERDRSRDRRRDRSRDRRRRRMEEHEGEEDVKELEDRKDRSEVEAPARRKVDAAALLKPAPKAKVDATAMLRPGPFAKAKAAPSAKPVWPFEEGDAGETFAL